jgi:ribose/xylose/arabinose/galactoside ABC-type transport system permease subunit
LLGVAAIAVLHNGIVHALQPEEMAGMFTGVLLILALTSSVLPQIARKMLTRKRADA